MTELILASTSSYKRALLERLGLPFRAMDPEVDESDINDPDPVRLARRRARTKAVALSSLHPRSLIIGSDQVLALGDRVFTKPGSIDAAVDQLLQLAGRAHQLHTAYALWCPPSGEIIQRVLTSTLQMRANLKRTYLTEMVTRDQTQDCVGGYKFESEGVFLFESIETPDPNAIVGLQLIQLAGDLSARGLFADRL